MRQLYRASPREAFISIKRIAPRSSYAWYFLPGGLTRIQEELSILRRHLPEGVCLIVGGAPAAVLGLEHAQLSMA